jgi:hypothetical protein
MNKLIAKFPRIADYMILPFVYFSAWLLKNIRLAGIRKLPLCKNALLRIGVFPIRSHYYEPQFDFRTLKNPLAKDRFLPGINWNTAEQLDILSSFTYGNELADIPELKGSKLEFYLKNGSFESGDAEYFYQIIRKFKPKRLFEIGSGNSTLMAIKAIKKNIEESPDNACKHLCIEPYEQPWLEKTGVAVIRQKIEDIDLSLMAELEENDILFIDSSHMIRPQGDVLLEYLELLPTLKKGVIVHVHDIFSPRDYPEVWIKDDVRFWNEQYMLEAFLSHNNNWRIIGALNYLHHNYYANLKSAAPSLKPSNEPGSFYLQKIF